MSISLKMQNSLDVLDLDGIAKTGFGFQALRGANVFGLPPVTNQWAEGAGDGATYRGRRVRSRDGDIPLDIVGRDRAHLKELVSRLSMMLAGPFVLVATEEDGTEWETVVSRSGGGGYMYGIDTVGQTDIQIIVTVTAGDPYWTARQSSVQQIGADLGVAAFLSNLVTMPVGSSQTIGTMTIENAGDATAYPVWTVHGPGSDFTAVSIHGETLTWTGTLAAGETLTLDTRRGTVLDGMGVNRYAELAAAPRFWTVPPGVTTSQVSMVGTGLTSKIVCSWRARKWMVI